MGAISPITTGEQTVVGTGPVTGVLSTAGLTGNFTVKIRVRGLNNVPTVPTIVQIALEDTANVTPFSDVTQPWVASFDGNGTREDVTQSVRSYQIPDCRFGVTNSALRVNVQSMTGTASAMVDAWIEQ
jgi:hypothetical protein